MVSVPKIVGVLSCGFLLCLGLSNVTQAVEKPPATERMKPDACADRKGGQPDLVKCDEETMRGIDTINGDVLRVEGDGFLVQRSDGKEVRLYTDETTQMAGHIGKGDRIEAKVNVVNDVKHVLSIRQAR